MYFGAEYAEYVLSFGSTTLNGNLDGSGCITIPISANTTYTFTVKTRAKVGGAVTIFVQPSFATTWTTPYVDSMSTTITTTSLLLDGHTYSFHLNQTGTASTMEVMPAFGQAMQKISTGEVYLPPGTYTRVSFNSTLCPSMGAQGNGNICLSTEAAHYKFLTLHEYGHIVSLENDGPNVPDYHGDDGVYAAEYNMPALTDGICDSTVTRDGADPGATHNFETREFIGAAMGEGFAHFISMAMLNYRTTNGEFKYYTNVMKSTYSHHDPLDGCAGTDPYCHAPLVPVSDYSATNYAVKWTTSECDPAGQSGGPSSFRHYGAEWDWLNFFWGLWVHSTNQYTIAEIMNLWNNTNGVHDADAARLCCVFLPLPNPNPPLGCLKRNMVSGSCGTYTNYFVVGKLWEVDAAFDSDGQISNEALAHFPGTKGDRFRNLGNWTGVDR
jgi:hypothetical protein